MNYDQKVKNRLRRVEGQIKGVLRMMEEEKDCKEIVTQLSAARSAIDRTIGVVVSSNLINCMQDENLDENKDELLKEAVDLFVKSR
ncbi:MAG TPA: metal-sensitive transcriptional regulator [Pseudogracilibacillus sp.]|nr:metal-sensitive transcriptional regulator [Pseudogracilibacillus sp.]